MWSLSIVVMNRVISCCHLNCGNFLIWKQMGVQSVLCVLAVCMWCWMKQCSLQPLETYCSLMLLICCGMCWWIMITMKPSYTYCIDEGATHKHDCMAKYALWLMAHATVIATYCMVFIYNLAIFYGMQCHVVQCHVVFPYSLHSWLLIFVMTLLFWNFIKKKVWSHESTNACSRLAIPYKRGLVI